MFLTGRRREYKNFSPPRSSGQVPVIYRMPGRSVAFRGREEVAYRSLDGAAAAPIMSRLLEPRLPNH